METGLFSLEFHKNFIFSVLLPKIKPSKKKEAASPFANHILLELPILTYASILAFLLGTSFAVSGAASSKSIFWGILGGLGLLGFLALFVMSVVSEKGSKYSFESFQPIIFFLCVLAGISSGIMAGFVYKSGTIMLLGGLGGLLIGYVSGIYLGVWVNYLGWMWKMFYPLYIGLIAGMAVTDVVLMLK